MGTAGDFVVVDGGKWGILPSGKFAIFNASGNACDCCEEAICDGTIYDTAYTDDFSSADPDWTLSSDLSITGGELVIGTTSSAEQKADRKFTFDPNLDTELLQSVEVSNVHSPNTANASISLGIELWDLDVFFRMRPHSVFNHFEWVTSDGFGTISQAPASGDILKTVITKTSAVDNGDGTWTLDFDVEFFINGTSKVTTTHTQLDFTGNFCGGEHGIFGSRGTGGTNSWDDYELTIT